MTDATTPEGTDLARARVRFPGISSRTWEHPADRGALVAMRTLTGFDSLLKALSGLVSERAIRLRYLSSAVRVDDAQFAGVNRLYGEVRDVLDVSTRPELYVRMDPVPNAMTIGIDKPFIVVTTALLDLLDDDEVLFILGHEVGHAQSGHAVYRTMLEVLRRFTSTFGWVPITGWGAQGLYLALMEWQRKSELSADRAGLLAGQDLDAALRTHMKLAGGARLDEMDVNAFLRQAEDYDSGGDLREGVLKLLHVKDASHPVPVLRAAELSRWVRAGGYDRVLRGEYPRRESDADASVSEEAQAAARSYKESFDVSGDPLLRALRDLGGGVASAANGVRDRVSGWVRGAGRSGEPPPEA